MKQHDDPDLRILFLFALRSLFVWTIIFRQGFVINQSRGRAFFFSTALEDVG